MEIAVPKLNSLTDSCFGLIFFFFRLVGTPFKLNKTSVIYAIYMRIAVFCGCGTVLLMCVDANLHRDYMEHIVANILTLIRTVNHAWVYLFCTYVISAPFS